jgi:hypothetical protein
LLLYKDYVLIFKLIQRERERERERGGAFTCFTNLMNQREQELSQIICAVYLCSSFWLCVDDIVFSLLQMLRDWVTWLWSWPWYFVPVNLCLLTCMVGTQQWLLIHILYWLALNVIQSSLVNTDAINPDASSSRRFF